MARIFQVVLVIGVIDYTLQITFVITGLELGSKQIFFHSTTKVVLLGTLFAYELENKIHGLGLGPVLH